MSLKKDFSCVTKHRCARGRSTGKPKSISFQMEIGGLISVPSAGERSGSEEFCFPHPKGYFGDRLTSTLPVAEPDIGWIGHILGYPQKKHDGISNLRPIISRRCAHTVLGWVSLLKAVSKVCCLAEGSPIAIPASPGCSTEVLSFVACFQVQASLSERFLRTCRGREKAREVLVPVRPGRFSRV